MISKKFMRKNSFKKWFPTQLNSMAKVFRTAVIQESLALILNEMPELPEFCGSTHILNWLISFHVFHSCTILVYSMGHIGFLLHLARFQHCNLGEFGWRTQVQTGSWWFYFPCCSILQKLSKLWHGNSCFVLCHKFLGFLFFLILFSCST